MRTKDTEKIAKLEQKINDYFYDCDALNNDKKICKPYTLSGLLCYIQLSRAEFEKLRLKRSFSSIITHALAKIEAFTEEYALTGALSASAAANSLKYNFGWHDSKNAEESSGTTKAIRLILDGELARLAE